MRLFGMQGSYANVNNKIRLLWTSDFNINIIHDSYQSVNGRINHVTSGTDFHLSMVYAKCRSIQRKLSWEEIVNISENIQVPWSLTGDFNVIAEIEEKLGGSPYRLEKSFDFLDFMTDVGVQNTRFSGNIRYWCNKRDSPDTIWKRLDRMLYNTEWFDLFSKTSVSQLARTCSDHEPLLIQFTNKEKVFTRYFKFLNTWTIHPQFLETIKKSWSIECQGNTMRVLH